MYIIIELNYFTFVEIWKYIKYKAFKWNSYETLVTSKELIWKRLEICKKLESINNFQRCLRKIRWSYLLEKITTLIRTRQIKFFVRKTRIYIYMYSAVHNFCTLIKSNRIYIQICFILCKIYSNMYFILGTFFVFLHIICISSFFMH